MNQVILAGETGQVRVTCELVQGDQCRAAVSIESWGYRAEGKVWFPVAALAEFHEQLRRCYAAVDGTARFTSGEGHLTLQVAFEPRTGHVTIEGSYRETMAEGNELRFRIQTDQSFIAGAWPEFAALAL